MVKKLTPKVAPALVAAPPPPPVMTTGAPYNIPINPTGTMTLPPTFDAKEAVIRAEYGWLWNGGSYLMPVDLNARKMRRQLVADGYEQIPPAWAHHNLQLFWMLYLTDLIRPWCDVYHWQADMPETVGIPYTWSVQDFLDYKRTQVPNGKVGAGGAV